MSKDHDARRDEAVRADTERLKRELLALGAIDVGMADDLPPEQQNQFLRRILALPLARPPGERSIPVVPGQGPGSNQSPRRGAEGTASGAWTVVKSSPGLMNRSASSLYCLS